MHDPHRRWETFRTGTEALLRCTELIKSGSEAPFPGNGQRQAPGHWMEEQDRMICVCPGKEPACLLLAEGGG